MWSCMKITLILYIAFKFYDYRSEVMTLIVRSVYRVSQKKCSFRRRQNLCQRNIFFGTPGRIGSIKSSSKKPFFGTEFGHMEVIYFIDSFWNIFLTQGLSPSHVNVNLTGYSPYRPTLPSPVNGSHIGGVSPRMSLGGLSPGQQQISGTIFSNDY